MEEPNPYLNPINKFQAQINVQLKMNYIVIDALASLTDLLKFYSTYRNANWFITAWKKMFKNYGYFL